MFSLREVSELDICRFQNLNAQVKDVCLLTSSAVQTELHVELMSQKSCSCSSDRVQTVSTMVYTLVVLTLL